MSRTDLPADEEQGSLRHYGAILRRRRTTVVAVLILVPLIALTLSVLQTPRYEATAEVLLTSQNLGDESAPDVVREAPRVAETQAALATVPAVARRAAARLRLTDRTPEEILEQTSVQALSNADILRFTLTDSDPELARRLATVYASEFTAYRAALDTQAIRRAREGVQRRLAEIPASERDSRLYTNLVTKEQDLETREALQTSNAAVVRSAEEAEQVAPRIGRNLVLALFVGLFLGVGLAFARDATDTRVRGEREIEDLLGLPLLARLPAPPAGRVDAGRVEPDRVAMLDQPTGHYAEAFRTMRTSFELANLGDAHAVTVMVTSAVAGEGKSVTVANLAVALARAGRNVALVDLDLRRPSLHRLFAVRQDPGLTTVALGQATLDEALRTVDLGEEGPAGGGRLMVLASGPPPPDAGEFVGADAVQKTLGALRRRADYVLVDTPPLLAFGDALTLTGTVDAMIVVTRLGHVPRDLLADVRRRTADVPVKQLGVVVTGVDLERGYGYGYRYDEGAAPGLADGRWPEAVRRALAGVRGDVNALWARNGRSSPGRDEAAATANCPDTTRSGTPARENGERVPSPPARRGRGVEPPAGTDATLRGDLEALVERDAGGDPGSPLSWTALGVRQLTEALRDQGHRVQYGSVAKLLRGLGYTAQPTRKNKASASLADRDAQFQHVNQTVRSALDAGEPAIGLNARKKERPGGPESGGREWDPTDSPQLIQGHGVDAGHSGEPIPHEIFDLADDEGWIDVGIQHDTAQFVVSSVRAWWEHLGRVRFPDAGTLTISAELGGSNGNRTRLWKTELQRLADATGLHVQVCHLPPGTRRWNAIDHRLLTFVNGNWPAKPLVSLEVIIDLLSATATRSGLEVYAQLDRRTAPDRARVSDAELVTVDVRGATFRPDWNYTINART